MKGFVSCFIAFFLTFQQKKGAGGHLSAFSAPIVAHSFSLCNALTRHFLLLYGVKSHFFSLFSDFCPPKGLHFPLFLFFSCQEYNFFMKGVDKSKDLCYNSSSCVFCSPVGALVGRIAQEVKLYSVEGASRPMRKRQLQLAVQTVALYERRCLRFSLWAIAQRKSKDTKTDLRAKTSTLHFQKAICRYGGIGRRARFRF